jgi:hypothetical protein
VTWEQEPEIIFSANQSGHFMKWITCILILAVCYLSYRLADISPQVPPAPIQQVAAVPPTPEPTPEPVSTGEPGHSTMSDLIDSTKQNPPSDQPTPAPSSH